MMFHDRIRRAQQEGRLGTCTCWDCVRAIGLTPPYELRNKHPRRYPHTIFDQNDGTGRGDPDGVPQGKASKSKSPKAQSNAEKAHLREAVRNREAI